MCTQQGKEATLELKSQEQRSVHTSCPLSPVAEQSGQLDAVRGVGWCYSGDIPSLGGLVFYNCSQKSYPNFAPGCLLYQHALTDSLEQNVSASPLNPCRSTRMTSRQLQRVLAGNLVSLPGHDDLCAPKHCYVCNLYISSALCFKALWYIRRKMGIGINRCKF